MKRNDWQEVLQGLEAAEVRLPQHEQVLREQLLTDLPVQESLWTRGKTTCVVGVWLLRGPVGSKRFLRLGLAVAVVAGLILGLVWLMPGSPHTSTRKLIATAASDDVRPLASTVAVQRDPACQASTACLQNSQGDDTPYVATSATSNKPATQATPLTTPDDAPGKQTKNQEKQDKQDKSKEKEEKEKEKEKEQKAPSLPLIGPDLPTVAIEVKPNKVPPLIIPGLTLPLQANATPAETKANIAAVTPPQSASKSTPTSAIGILKHAQNNSQ